MLHAVVPAEHVGEVGESEVDVQIGLVKEHRVPPRELLAGREGRPQRGHDLHQAARIRRGARCRVEPRLLPDQPGRKEGIDPETLRLQLQLVGDRKRIQEPR